MRIANFERDVLKAIGHELGIDVQSDINRDHAAAWTQFANNWTEEIWPVWDWAEIEITEERPFRTIWNSTRLFYRAGANGKPDEVFYIPTMAYYQVKPTAPSDPAAGVLPTNLTYYTPLTITDRYLEYDLPGRRAMGLVRGVYAGDPRSNGYVRGLRYRPSGKGLDVAGGGPTVFVRYQIPPSTFDATVFVLGTAYKTGDRRVWSQAQGGTGQCYRAISDNTNILPSNTTYWAVVPLPKFMARYVVYNAAADAESDKATKDELREKGEIALQRAVDNQVVQGRPFPRYRINGRRWCGDWRESLAWTEGATTVTTLTDSYIDLEGDAGGGIPVGPQAEGRLTALTAGRDYVDLVFTTPKVDGLGSPTGNWEFTELTVETTDPDPYKIFPTVISAKTGAGGRVWLNADPPNGNYSLRWRVTV